MVIARTAKASDWSPDSSPDRRQPAIVASALHAAVAKVESKDDVSTYHNEGFMESPFSKGNNNVSRSSGSTSNLEDMTPAYGCQPRNGPTIYLGDDDMSALGAQGYHSGNIRKHFGPLLSSSLGAGSNGSKLDKSLGAAHVHNNGPTALQGFHSGVSTKDTSQIVKQKASPQVIDLERLPSPSPDSNTEHTSASAIEAELIKAKEALEVSKDKLKRQDNLLDFHTTKARQLLEVMRRQKERSNGLEQSQIAFHHQMTIRIRELSATMARSQAELARCNTDMRAAADDQKKQSDKVKELTLKVELAEKELRNARVEAARSRGKAPSIGHLARELDNAQPQLGYNDSSKKEKFEGGNDGAGDTKVIDGAYPFVSTMKKINNRKAIDNSESHISQATSKATQNNQESSNTTNPTRRIDINMNDQEITPQMIQESFDAVEHHRRRLATYFRMLSDKDTRADGGANADAGAGAGQASTATASMRKRDGQDSGVESGERSSSNKKSKNMA